MHRRAGVLLLALAALAPAPAGAEPLQEALRSVVSVLPEWPPDARRTEEPEGSGVVVLDGRTILTAAHIVDKARSIRVRTSDGEIIDAEMEARDGATDLALVSIATELPAIAVEEADPELGEEVCAIGNAFGQGLSLTCGVVSGVHRAGVGFNAVEDFVQTDAAVNPGASGGALVNREGRMVGLLSAIFTKQSDANIGVNFAVSAPLAMRVAKALKEHGRVQRAVSGLRLVQAPEKGETGRLGARVAAVRPDTPGEKAGLRPGDIIVRAGERRIRRPADFVSVLSVPSGETPLEVEAIRGEEELTVRFAP